ncbi:MAG: hypothetical protein JWM02_700 [Frankiales bacterium]|nr:hypothetical protein [Frankiales bacterium]
MITVDGVRAISHRAAPSDWSQRAVDAVATWLSGRTSRRGFLARSAVVGSALAVDGVGFLLKPQSAYASVCGPSSSCASGWTVFCATINKGVNTCPPGSIAAGWWKADGASLCGGRARYIIDCNATCSRCATPGRAGICAPQCWSCRCTCGPAGQCDNRRVCCNRFRYGQCNQQVHQVGAVQCRVASCIPPWKFANCSTATATDNRTRDHNSPALPGAWSPITARYVQLGERKSILGATVYGEVARPGGRAQRYVNGRMSWKASIGPRFTVGAIASRYTALGSEAGVLGYPVVDPGTVRLGKASRFQHGRISWHPSLGAFETVGAIAIRYAAAGNELGRLGFPVARPVATRDGSGRASAFQHGRISWHPTTGARFIGEPIAKRYVALRAEAGKLAYPVKDEVFVGPGIAAVAFQGGRIVWSASTGAIEMYDVMAVVYARSGGERGPLGLPVASETAVLDGRAQRFQTGRISARAASAFFTRGPISAKYTELGAETGQLGWPITDEYSPSTGQRRNDFETGSITYDEATGEVAVIPNT